MSLDAERHDRLVKAEAELATLKTAARNLLEAMETPRSRKAAKAWDELMRLT